MKELKHFWRALGLAVGIVWAGLTLTGCQTEPVFAEFPNPATQPGPGNEVTAYTPPANDTDILFIGDVVTVIFNSGDQNPLPPHQEAIKDDGRITPPFVGSIMAKGKSPGALQAELQKLYDVLYKHMTVTVSSKDRYYSVSGEVKNPGTKPYLGKTDLVSAISAASDFTEFANKKEIRVNHPNGKFEIINYYRAIEDPKKNIPIYPLDAIIVPRRFF